MTGVEVSANGSIPTVAQGDENAADPACIPALTTQNLGQSIEAQVLSTQTPAMGLRKVRMDVVSRNRQFGQTLCNGDFAPHTHRPRVPVTDADLPHQLRRKR